MSEHDSPAALYARARSQGALFDLSARAQWRLSGADRVRYLNGQVTSDIRRARPDAAHPACVTTAKGRLCGLIFVSAAPDFLRIDAEAELRDPLTARLERYIIADDVTLEDITGAQSLFHLLPPSPPSDLSDPSDKSDISLPSTAESRAATRFARPGIDILGPPATDPSLLTTTGVPLWNSELTGETLPPEAGLDQTAIDYHKGCYIGQEVISRIKSVGHVNRRLCGFTAGAPLTPGMTLHPSAEPDKIAGEITSAAWSFGLETWIALGYLKRGFDHVPLHARAPDGAIAGVQTRDLPFVP